MALKDVLNKYSFGRINFLFACLLLVVLNKPNFLGAQQFIDAYESLPIPTNQKVLDTEKDVFRFAIMSDRTGGMQPGIFKVAAQKIELLQPEFVLSVGDLIDGYTESPAVWETQWDEFDGIVNQLSMPFYYVPGNHDTSNEILTNVWRERHGKDYYTFRHKDVLFVVINTDEIEGGGISKVQSDYLIKKIEAEKDVKWIMVFMHRPVWSYGDDMGYTPIEQTLVEQASQGKKYTVYSGHHHHYRYATKNGQEHFTLATTGGGSYLRGVGLGEFNHITWVTMKETGPEVAHLELDGIHPKDIIKEEDYDDIQILRSGQYVELKDILVTDWQRDELASEILLSNTSSKPMHIEGNLPNHSLVKFNPSSLDIKLEPGEHARFPYTLTVSIDSVYQDREFYNNHPLYISLKGSFDNITSIPTQLNTRKRLRWETLHTPQILKKKSTLDAQLDEWEELRYAVEKPVYIKEDWDWYGPDDGKFHFDVATESEQLLIAMHYEDDKIIKREFVYELQDKFKLVLRPLVTKDSEVNTSVGEAIEIDINLDGKMNILNDSLQDLSIGQSVVKESRGGYVLEIRIDLAQLNLGTHNQWQINVGVMDHDRPENTKPSVLWWRPLDSSRDVLYGQFNFK